MDALFWICLVLISLGSGLGAEFTLPLTSRDSGQETVANSEKPKTSLTR
jgi:hypothetical protein